MFWVFCYGSTSFLYKLFLALEALAPNVTKEFIYTYGYALEVGDGGKTRLITTIQRVDDFNYKQGRITFPILTVNTNKALFRDIARCVALSDVTPQRTNDTPDFDAVRMRTVRDYVLPWSFIGINPDRSGEMSPFGSRIDLIMDVMRSLVLSYATLFRSMNPKSSFGNTNSKVAVLAGMYQEVSQEFKVELGQVIHCNLNKLRVLGENSIYVMDDNFTGSLEVRTKRPQLAALMNQYKWDNYLGPR